MAKKQLSPDTDPLATFSKLERHSVCEGGFITPHRVDVEHFDLDRAEPQEIANQCVDPDSIRKALIVRKAVRDDVYRMTKEAAIYVIGTPDHTMSKVGVSCNPLSRITQLQSGCPIQLKLSALFWIVDGEPVGYEKTIHKVAADMGYKVTREWIDATPGQTAFLAATILHKSNAKVADSAMWVRQREMIRLHMRGDEYEFGTYW